MEPVGGYRHQLMFEASPGFVTESRYRRSALFCEKLAIDHANRTKKGRVRCQTLPWFNPDSDRRQDQAASNSEMRLWFTNGITASSSVRQYLM